MTHEAGRITLTVMVVSVLVGVAVGEAVVGYALWSNQQPLRLTISSVAEDARWTPDCHPSECANISIEFSGASQLDPRLLFVSIAPTNAYQVINHTAGNPLHLSYQPNTGPVQLWPNPSPGNFTYPPGGRFVNPDGRVVAWGGDPLLVPGFTLSFIGFYSGPLLAYALVLDYQGAHASALVSVT